MSAARHQRQLSRANVRSISYVELLLVVVFTILLTLAGAQQDLADAREEISNLAIKTEPKQETHLVRISNLEADQKRKLAEIDRLNKEISEYQKVKALIEQADKRGRDLIGDVQLMWKFEPVIKRLKRLLDGPKGRTDDAVLAEAAQTLEEQQTLIASLESSVGNSPQQSAKWIARLQTDLANKEKERQVQVASMNVQLESQKAINRALQNKMDGAAKKAGRGGRDDPSCWLTASDSIVAVFNIQIHDDGYIISPAWTSDFANIANNTASIINLLKARGPTNFLTVEDFKRLAKAIKAFANSQDDGKTRCVYYANTEDKTKTARKYSTNKNYVDRYFYPYRTE